MGLHYLIGDATKPTVKPALICHVCNDIGAFGAGFVAALSKKSQVPEYAYKTWHREGKTRGNPIKLGDVQFVSFLDGNFVCNMISQKGIHAENGIPPIRYDALNDALVKANKFAKDNSLVIAAPRLGAKLAGGDWTKIETIIKSVMQVDTYIYTLDSEKNDWPGTKYENDTPDVDLNTVFS